MPKGSTCLHWSGAGEAEAACSAVSHVYASLRTSCSCRFIVVQQRSAIAVEAPLALSAYLQRLAGLEDLETCIAAKAAESRSVAEQCEALAAETERCALAQCVTCAAHVLCW